MTADCEDRVGHLIVGTFGSGVYWFDSEGRVTRLTGENGLSHNSVLSLLVDREGCLWIGTNGGGLNRVKRQTFDVVERTRGYTVQSLSQDASGNLWIGYNGDWVDRCSASSTQQFSVVPSSYGSSIRSASYVKAVFVDQNQRVLVGLSSPGPAHLFYFEKDGFRKF